MRMRRSRAEALCIAALLAASCSADPGPVSSDDIQGRDRVIFPSARATWDILRPARERRREAEAAQQPKGATAARPRPFQWSLIGELDLDYGEGESSHEMVPGELILFDGATFNGPGRLHSAFEMFHAMAGVRAGLWLKETVGLEAIGGLSLLRLDLEIKSAALSEERETTLLGFTLGLQLNLRPIEELTLYGRAMAMDGFESDFDQLLETVEAGASLALAKGTFVFAGFRYWNYDEDYFEDEEADLDFKLTGPVFGIGFGF